MGDQTRYGIDEIISEWLEECPVMYAHIEFMDENIVSYKFKITKRRNK